MLLKLQTHQLAWVVDRRWDTCRLISTSDQRPTSPSPSPLSVSYLLFSTINNLMQAQMKWTQNNFLPWFFGNFWICCSSFLTILIYLKSNQNMILKPSYRRHPQNSDVHGKIFSDSDSTTVKTPSAKNLKF